MEYLDIYNDFGEVTGKVIQRGDKNVKLKSNEHIAVGVIYIENSEGNYLIQKTSKTKGGLYSSTGGHVCSGESPLESIKREVMEELGVDISNDKIEELGFILYDAPIRYMFYLKKDVNIEDINIQKEEVDYVEYMSFDKINNLINNDLMLKSHGIIFKEILKYKNNN